MIAMRNIRHVLDAGPLRVFPWDTNSSQRKSTDRTASVLVLIVIITLTSAIRTADAHSSDVQESRQEPWSITVYGGPWTQRVVSEVIGRGRFDISGGMIGAAVDRRLFELGWGFSFGLEGQVTQTVSGHGYETFALGIGLEFAGFPWRRQLPTTLSVYTGPSYATNPPIEYYDPSRPQHPWLNYVGIELAVALPGTSNWDGIIRVYHRSGVWGVYSINADEGSTVGAGLRYRW